MATKADCDLVVGATRFGKMYRRSKRWGARRLREWALEQANGGPVRVFIGPGGGIYTTIAVLQKEMPCAEAVDRELQERTARAQEAAADVCLRLDAQAVRYADLAATVKQ